MRWPLMRLEIAGDSMAPTYRSGDWIVARRTSSPRVGSVVVATVDGCTTLKRVVALSGQTVTVDGGVVAIDGVPWDDSWDGATRPDGTWTLSSDEVFVLGDNRPHSTDSRHHGPIQTSSVQGVAMVRYRRAQASQ